VLPAAAVCFCMPGRPACLRADPAAGPVIVRGRFPGRSAAGRYGRRGAGLAAERLPRCGDGPEDVCGWRQGASSASARFAAVVSRGAAEAGGEAGRKNGLDGGAALP